MLGFNKQPSLTLTHLIDDGRHAERHPHQQDAHEQQQARCGNDGPASTFREILGVQPSPASNSPNSCLSFNLLLSSLLALSLSLSSLQGSSSFLEVLQLLLASLHVEGDVIGIVVARHQDLSDKQSVPYFRKYMHA